MTDRTHRFAHRRDVLAALVAAPLAGRLLLGCASGTSAGTQADADAAGADTASGADSALSGDTASGADSALSGDTASGADTAPSADTASGADTTVAADTASGADTTVAADTASGADSAVAADTATGSDTAQAAVCDPTLGDAQGPFYVADAPSVADIAAAEEPGDRMAIAGLVLDADCNPIPGAVVEVWQADEAGDYHDDKLRATLAADGVGGYAFRSIKPGRYLQPNGYRPAHVHYRVSAPGYRTVVSQLYFEGDPYLQPNDSCGSCGSDDPGRIIPLAAGRVGLSGVFDVVLEALA